ncbi:hypothetical protein L3Q82_026684, partial [Scortum barcoo]
HSTPSSPGCCWGQAAASWGGSSPHFLDSGLDYLTHRPQFVRVQGFESDRLLCSTSAPCRATLNDGDDREYRGLIQDFADWCLRNNLQINAGKTKELVVDFRRRSHSQIRLHRRSADVITRWVLRMRVASEADGEKMSTATIPA